MRSLTIFFPFLNDAGTVALLIEQAYFFGKQVSDDLEVIAIHGGPSKDQTLEEIHKAKSRYPDLIILDHFNNPDGYGVIRHGFRAATKEWVFYTDGDGQYHLKDLQKLVATAVETSSDVVNGFKTQRSDPWLRVFLGKGYQLFCRLLFRLPIRDIDCDFRLIRREHLKQIEFRSKGSSILPELILKLKQSGARFSEVPVNHYARVYGRSNYSAAKLLLEKLIGDFQLWGYTPSTSSEATVFQAMHTVEEQLWWYVALRETIQHRVQKKMAICDVGCGTGCTIKFLQDRCYNVQGVDISPIALSYCTARGVKNCQLGSITNLPFPSGSFDIVLLMDVLCMLEDPERVQALQELQRILKPGGELILNEPAFPWLQSQHDLSCYLKKRFRKKECIDLFISHGFEIIESSYRVCFLFPAVALVKLVKKWTLQLGSSPKSDLKLPSRPFNWLFLAIQRLENRLLKRGYTMPFGSSVFLVARKTSANATVAITPIAK
jgi:SAM-dependent methyltransferase